MYEEPFSTEKVTQGTLGNCYFLSALAALTKSPERIKNIIKTKEVNSAGIYCVQLFINGFRMSIVVDDFIPVFNGTTKPAFCHSKT